MIDQARTAITTTFIFQDFIFLFFISTSIVGYLFWCNRLSFANATIIKSFTKGQAFSVITRQANYKCSFLVGHIANYLTTSY